MAKLIGIDIRGRFVRAVLIGTSYRRIALESLAEIDRAQFPALEQAVQACLLPLVQHADAIAVAIDGDLSFVHRFSLPITAQKQLADVIPFELEAQVPVDIDSLIFDYMVLPRRDEGSFDVLAAAARTEHVKERLGLISRAVSREAERVGVGALPLANLGSVIAELGAEGAVAVVELADDRSEVVVLERGHPIFARTLSIGVSGLPQSAPALAAQLRQTVTAVSVSAGASISAVYLTGGGSAAAGAESYLAAELGVTVVGLPRPDMDGLTPEQTDVLPRFARALGLALGLRGRARDLDLRRGELSYQRSYTFLKEKAPLLGALGATILVSFFFATWAELRSLGREHDALAQELAAASKDALGEEADDAERVKELLENAASRAEVDPMPHFDGFDLMVELSKAVPTSITHDIEELELSREHARIRGIVGSAAEAQQIGDGMKQNKCMSDVKITKVSQVVNSTRQKYQLEADIKCPEDAAATKRAEAEEEGGK
jgi:general secretion pathway protein L